MSNGAEREPATTELAHPGSVLYGAAAREYADDVATNPLMLSMGGPLRISGLTDPTHVGRPVRLPQRAVPVGGSRVTAV